jgi:hypothetical protein
MVVTQFSIRTLITDVDWVSETPMYLQHLTRLPATDNFYSILSPSKLYITMLCISYGPMVSTFLCTTRPNHFIFDLKKVTFTLLLSIGIWAAFTRAGLSLISDTLILTVLNWIPVTLDLIQRPHQWPSFGRFCIFTPIPKRPSGLGIAVLKSRSFVVSITFHKFWLPVSAHRSSFSFCTFH